MLHRLCFENPLNTYVMQIWSLFLPVYTIRCHWLQITCRLFDPPNEAGNPLRNHGERSERSLITGELCFFDHFTNEHMNYTFEHLVSWESRQRSLHEKPFKTQKPCLRHTNWGRGHFYKQV